VNYGDVTNVEDVAMDHFLRHRRRKRSIAYG
jgi:hypothetical protein